MKDKWLVFPDDNKLSIIDIDDSPNTTDKFKHALIEYDEISYSSTKKEYICSPYQAQEIIANVIELPPEGKELKAKIDSLVEYCEENDINYVRFSI